MTTDPSRYYRLTWQRSAQMHTILACLSKLKTSLACKSIYTFFVATVNEECIKNILYLSSYTLYIFRQQYRRKMKCINCEKSMFIHFSQFIHFSLYHSFLNFSCWTCIPVLFFSICFHIFFSYRPSVLLIISDASDLNFLGNIHFQNF